MNGQVRQMLELVQKKVGNYFNNFACPFYAVFQLSFFLLFINLFLPLPSANSILIKPFFSYTFRATSVFPLMEVRPINLLISFLCNKSFLGSLGLYSTLLENLYCSMFISLKIASSFSMTAKASTIETPPFLITFSL